MKEPQPITIRHSKLATVSGFPIEAGPQPPRRPTRRLDAEELASLRRALANRRETGWSTVEEASKNSELYRQMRDYLPALLDMAEEDLRLRAIACQCEYGASAHCPVHGVLPELVATPSL